VLSALSTFYDLVNAERTEVRRDRREDFEIWNELLLVQSRAVLRIGGTQMECLLLNISENEKYDTVSISNDEMTIRSIHEKEK
jgi:hypothetical protein